MLHRARWLRQTYKTQPDAFCVLVYTNVLNYFLRHSLDFLGIPKENVRTFDDWCSELWDRFVHKPKPRTPPDRRGKSYIDFAAVRTGVFQCLQALAASCQPRPSLDFVLVDEGQDLDAPAWRDRESQGGVVEGEGRLHLGGREVAEGQQGFSSGLAEPRDADLGFVCGGQAVLCPASITPRLLLGKGLGRFGGFVPAKYPLVPPLSRTINRTTRASGS